MDTVVFDKTGTLTEGKPSVTAWHIVRDSAWSPQQFFRLMAAAEVGLYLLSLLYFQSLLYCNFLFPTLQANSEHPIAKAILEASRKFLGIPEPAIEGSPSTSPGTGKEDSLLSHLPAVSTFEAIPGKGVKCQVAEGDLLLGNERLLEDEDVAVPQEAQKFLEEVRAAGRTGIAVSLAGSFLGAVSVSDPVKPEARNVILALKKMFKVQCIILTGDSWQTARAIASELGVQRVFAQVLPSGKAQKIKELQVFL